MHDYIWLGGEGDLLRIRQEFETRPFGYLHKPESVLENRTQKFTQIFMEYENDSDANHKWCTWNGPVVWMHYLDAN